MTKKKCLLDAASRPIGCQSKVQGNCCIRQRNIHKKLLSALSSNKSCHKTLKLFYSVALTHLFIVGFEIIHNSSQGNLSRADLLLSVKDDALHSRPSVALRMRSAPNGNVYLHSSVWVVRKSHTLIVPFLTTGDRRTCYVQAM